MEPNHITSVVKDGPLMIFTRNDGKKAIFDLRDGRPHFSEVKDKEASLHSFKRFFGKMDFYAVTGKIGEAHPTYKSIIEIVKNKERRCNNIGTLLQRFFDNYRHVEKWELLGIKADSYKYSPENFTKEALRYFKEENVAINYHTFDIWNKNSDKMQFVSALYQIINKEFENEPIERHIAMALLKDSNLIQRVQRLVTLGYDRRRLLRYVYDYLPNRENLVGYGNTALQLLEDYANMRSQMAMGHSWEKYPRYLKSIHDITTRNFQNFKKEYDVNMFKKAAEDFQEYAWTGKYVKEIEGEIKEETEDATRERWMTVIPQHPDELKREGVELQHCVGSYIDRVANKELAIVFFRKKADEALITLEIRTAKHHNAVVSNEDDKAKDIEGYILQARGLQNRLPDEEELKAIEEFCKKMKLRYDQK